MLRSFLCCSFSPCLASLALTVAGLLAGSLGAAVASAQGGAEPERLFREGVALREAGDLDGAIERLRRAQRLDDDDRTAYNLAAALADDGQLVEARALARRIVARDPDLLIGDAAHDLIDAVTPRIATVSVLIEGGPDGERLVVDGERSAMAGNEREVSLDPGRHRFEVHARDGTVLARSDLEVREGERREVILHPVSAAPVVRAPTDVADARGGDVHGDDTWLWVGIGSGIAASALIVAIVVAVLLGSQGAVAIDGDLDDVRVGGRSGSD